VSVNVISFEILKKYKVGGEIVRLCCTTAVSRASYQSTFTEKSLLSCLELKVILLFSSFVPKRSPTRRWSLKQKYFTFSKMVLQAPRVMSRVIS